MSTASTSNMAMAFRLPYQAMTFEHHALVGGAHTTRGKRLLDQTLKGVHKCDLPKN